MIPRLVINLLAASSLALAQDRSPVEPATLPAPDQAVEPVKPAIKKLDAHRYEVGSVTFDQKTREIRFPAKVNMVEGFLEYLVVHQNGKVHESLLATEVSPTHVNLAFTLLRYPASRELYLLPNDTGGLSDQFPDVPANVKSASRISIEVEWQDSGKTRRSPVNEWIQHEKKNTTMKNGPWVYGGSEFYDGKYVPESCGDIAAIFISQSALINYPGEDNQDDTVWVPFPKRVPSVGTNVTVIIAPYTKPQAASKP